jgi:hypothetical protein
MCVYKAVFTDPSEDGEEGAVISEMYLQLLALFVTAFQLTYFLTLNVWNTYVSV